MQHKCTKNRNEEIAAIGAVGLITARGGSKSLPRKNVLPVAGKPLIAWTISAALESKSINQIVLSSDDDEIIKTAMEWGCPASFRRPAQLASDEASSIDVVLHALDQLPAYEFVILLQPTSPFRSSEDIDAAFKLMQSKGAPSCVSVCEVEQSPYWMYRLSEEGRLEKLLSEKTTATRRQDLPPVYMLNGAIYIANVDWLRRTKTFLGEGCVAYRMPKERSLDIDTKDDFDAFRRKVEGN